MAKPQSFKKGDPRINRNGRPPAEWTMSSLYKEAGEEADETGVPRKKIVAQKLWTLAQRGDVVAIKELNNRIDGQSPQAINMAGEVKQEILHIYKPAKLKGGGP